MQMKLGRNEPCPCGSGKKLKHCHGDPRGGQRGTGRRPPPEIFDRAREHLARLEAEERERTRQYGDIRPIIGVQNWGKQFVAVRNRIYWGSWKYFPDFLDYFLQARFGQDWTEAQNRLDPAAQHPLSRWRARGLSYNKAVTKQAGRPGVPPNGFMAAYFGFAYDLYVVDDNNDLDDQLLERLKNREQFQGARHELFAEATCLRAGFDVTHENERDPNRRHVEFIATHKNTGLRIAVEAKSRHRAGVLAQAGHPVAEDQVDFKFARLIHDAIAKQPGLPLAIFLDTNLPPLRARKFYGPRVSPPQPSLYLQRILEETRKRSGGTDPHNVLVFTNIPHHYGRDDELDPPRDWIAYIAQVPSTPVHNPEILHQLARASELYGNVPNALPKNR
jgi:uncharacterized protein YchJ